MTFKLCSAIFPVLQRAFIGALDLSNLGGTIENMEGPTAPIRSVCGRHNVPFFTFYCTQNICVLSSTKCTAWTCPIFNMLFCHDSEGLFKNQYFLYILENICRCHIIPVWCSAVTLKVCLKNNIYFKFYNIFIIILENIIRVTAQHIIIL